MPQPARIIDLSVPLGPSPSEAIPVEIEYMDHKAGGRHLAELANVSASSLPDEMAWASERVHAVTHCGTHVDAPFHYSPTCNGAPSRTIDELPLEWFFAPGIRIRANGNESKLIDLDEFHRAENQLGHKIVGPEIVLFDTGASQSYGMPDYNNRGRGISPELMELLCDRGVKVIGTDAWSIDPPFARMGRQGNSVWGAHYIGRKHEFCVIERLFNLPLLCDQGFWISCFPIKVLRGSGAWIRAAALFF